MRLVLEDEIHSYCDDDDDRKRARRREFSQASGSVRGALPMFELCRALYYGVRLRGVRPVRFRECWGELVKFCDECLAEHNGGSLLFDLGDRDAALAILDAALDESEPRPPSRSARSRDRREDAHQHLGQARRFREAHVRRVDDLQEEHGKRLRWQCSSLPELPDRNGFVRGNDLVLDTNILLEVLVALSNRGSLARLESRIPLPVRERLRRSIESRGLASRGRLIVPCITLEEADRVARNDDKYQPVPGALRRILDLSSTAPWSRFEFMGITAEVVGALCALLEAFHVASGGGLRWPEFADAMILAFGLANGAPVVSSEWNEKDDWADVARFFPDLVVR